MGSAVGVELRQSYFIFVFNMKALHMVAFVLVIVGALNWGLVGLGSLMGGADWNLVHMILGSMMPLEALVYVLVGLSGVWLVISHRKDCRQCATSSAM